jgi:osmotically-inducible protein OsmY
MVASTNFPVVSAPELRDRVESALVSTGHLHGRNLRFEVAEDVVVLKGVVRSYFLKQMAQEAVRAVLGGLRLSNELEVTRAGSAN